MDSDERSICIYLKSWPGQFVSGTEISRRAGGKHRYRTEPNWASPALCRLVDREFIESDAAGHYRLRRRDRNRQCQETRWLSPHIKSILRESGKDFSEVIEIEVPDDFFADEELQP